MSEELARYESIPNLSRDEVETAIRNDDVEVLIYASLSASLSTGDATWAEETAYRLIGHSDPTVRGNAYLSLGHVARIFGTLNRNRAIASLEIGKKDMSSYVRGHAEDALDDIEQYLA